jgi:hypothetical protein
LKSEQAVTVRLDKSARVHIETVRVPIRVIRIIRVIRVIMIIKVRLVRLFGVIEPSAYTLSL